MSENASHRLRFAYDYRNLLNPGWISDSLIHLPVKLDHLLQSS